VKPKLLILKYLFWAGVFSCFIGSVLRINVFGIGFFPLRVISLVAFPLLLLHPVRKERGIWRFSSRLLILMLIYGIASLLWSPDPQLGFNKVGILFTGVVFFLLITREARDREVLMKIMIIWSVAIICIGLLGYYEIISGHYLTANEEGLTAGVERIVTSYGWLPPRVFSTNWNNTAFLNALSALVLLGWALKTRGLYRIIALISVMSAITMVIVSSSRAAILGLVIGLIVFILISITNSNIKLFFRTVTIFLFIGLSAILLLKDREFSINKMLANIETKLETVDDSIRIYYYSTAVVKGTVDSYGFGKGLGASTEIIDGGSYHHYLLEILAELGFWFFLGHCILLAMVCSRLWRAIRQRRNISWSSGLLASCIAFPILCAGPSSIIGDGPYWLWLAVLVAFTEYDSNVMRLNNE